LVALATTLLVTPAGAAPMKFRFASDGGTGGNQWISEGRHWQCRRTNREIEANGDELLVPVHCTD
jgi:hypothetical protein